MLDKPITAYNALEPIIVRNIREAFDGAVKELEILRGFAAPPETLAQLARVIVDQARHGECDVGRLRGAALSAIAPSLVGWRMSAPGNHPLESMLSPRRAS